MHRRILVLVACATLVATARAQKPPLTPPDAKPPAAPGTVRETTRPLTVQGCVFDTRLKVGGSEAINAAALELANEFVLEGPKELMRQLKADHNGHEEIISGIVTIPALDDRDTLSSSKRVGKTTITAHGSQAVHGGGKAEKPRPPLHLKVEEVRHVETKCPYPV
jgi:hypothetical protein